MYSKNTVLLVQVSNEKWKLFFRKKMISVKDFDSNVQNFSIIIFHKKIDRKCCRGR